MTVSVAISLLALIVAMFTLTAHLRQRTVIYRLTRQVENLETQLPGQISAVKAEAPVASRFSAHLHDAEKDQQKTREEFQGKGAVKPQVQADKYRYAVALAAQGQNVDSIAQALNMAPAEVEQVMQLARVKLQA